MNMFYVTLGILVIAMPTIMIGAQLWNRAHGIDENGDLIETNDAKCSNRNCPHESHS